MNNMARAYAHTNRSDKSIALKTMPPSSGLEVLFSRVVKEVVVSKIQGGLVSSATPDVGATKRILNNVSGRANPGEILCLMVRAFKVIMNPWND